MTTDRTTKALLFAIALGLWLDVAGRWLPVTPVEAQSRTLSDTATLLMISSNLAQIASDTSAISRNTANIPRPSLVK